MEKGWTHARLSAVQHGLSAVQRLSAVQLGLSAVHYRLIAVQHGIDVLARWAATAPEAVKFDNFLANRCKFYKFLAYRGKFHANLSKNCIFSGKTGFSPF